MSHWNSKTQKVIRWSPKKIPGYPGWRLVDCGCCAGLEWGGDYPHECKRCMNGWISEHKESGVTALYPGGPFC